MEILFILGVFESWLLSSIVFLKKERNKADIILAIFFLIVGLNILFAYLETYNSHNSYPYPAFINTTAPWVLLHGPLLWFYILQQTTLSFKFRPVMLLHFVPFLLMIIDHSINFYFIPTHNRIEIAQSEVFTQYITYPVFVLLIAFSPLYYCIRGINRINTYNRQIKNQLSKVELYDFRWLVKVLYAILILYCFINLFFIIDMLLPIGDFKTLQSGAFGLTSLLMLVIGFFGHKQHNLFESHLAQTVTVLQPALESKTADEKDQLFIQKMEKFMNDSRVYLEPELTVFKLAEELNTNQIYISNILNQQLEKNFFEYVNTFRIEEFKQKLEQSDNDKYTIISLAYESGFNSKATFNRVFKKQVGCTPNIYRKSLGL